MLQSGIPISNNKIISDNIEQAFEERKKQFFQSLKKCLLSISSDSYIKQMFEDNESATFIPNRICEIIKESLKNDRENLIQALIYQSNSFETLFGKQQFNNFLQIAKQINLNDQVIYNPESELNKLFVDLLMKQIEIIRPGYMNTIKKYVNSFPFQFYQKTINNIKQDSIFIQQTLILTREDISIFQAQFLKLIEGSKNKCFHVLVALINQLKNTQNNQQTLELQYGKMTKQFNQIDIPKIKNIYENEIQQYEKKENELIKQLQESRENESKIKEENKKIEMKFTKLQSLYDSLLNDSRIDKTKGSISTYQIKIRELEAELIGKQKQIDNLMDNIGFQSKTNIVIEKYQYRIHELESENSKLKLSIEEKEHDKQEALRKKSEIDAEFGILKTKFTSQQNSQKIIQILDNKIDNLTNESNELKNSIASLQKEKEDLELTNEKLRQELDEKNIIISQLNKKDSESIKLSLEIQSFQRKIDEQNNKINELTNQNLILQNSLSQQQIDNTIVLPSFKLDDTNENTLTSNQQSQNHNLDDYRNLLKAAKKQLRKKEKELKDLSATKEEIEKSCALINSQLSAANDSVIHAQNNYKEMEKQYLSTKEELRQKNLLIDRILSNDDDSSQLLSVKHFELETLKNEASQQVQVIRNLQLLTQNQQAQIDERNHKINDLLSKVQKKDSLIKKLKNENGIIVNKLEEQIQESQSLQNQIDIHQKSIEKQKIEIEKFKTEKMNIQNINEQLKEESQKNHLNMAQMKKDFDSQLNKLNQQIENLNEKINKLSNEKQKLQKMILSLEDTIDEHDSTTQQLQDEKQNLIEKQSRETQNYKSMIQNLSKTNTQLQSANEKLNQKMMGIENQLQTIMGVSDFQSFPETLKKLLNKNQQIKVILDKIQLIIGCNKNTEIISKLTNMKQDLDDFASYKKKIQNDFPNSPENQFYQKIDEIINQNNLFIALQNKICNLLQINPEEILRSISTLKESYDNTINYQMLLESKIPKEFTGSFDSMFSQLVTKYKELKNQFQQISEVLSDGDLEEQSKSNQDYTHYISTIIQKLKEKNLLLQSIQNLLHEDSNLDTTSIDKLSQNLIQLQQFQDLYNEINNIIPQSYHGPILSRIQQLVKNNKEIQNEQKQISEILPSELVGSLLNRIQQLINYFNSLNSQHINIKNILSVRDEEIVEEKVQKLFNSYTALQQNNLQIRKILSLDEDKDVILTIQQIIDKRDSLEKEKESLISILEKTHLIESLPTSEDIDLNIVLNSFIDKANELEEANKVISSIVSKYEGSSSVEKINNLKNSDQKSTSILYEIDSIIPSTSEDKTLIERIQLLSQQCEELKLQKEQISSCLGNGNETIPEKIELLIDEINVLNDEKRKILNMIPESIIGSPIERISQLIDRFIKYQKFEEELSKIQNSLTRDSQKSESTDDSFQQVIQKLILLQDAINLIPPEYTGLPKEKVTKILSSIQELQDEELEIQKFIPNQYFEGSLSNKVSDMNKDIQRLSKLEIELNAIIPTPRKSPLPERVKNIIKTINEYKTALSQIVTPSLPPSDAIQKVQEKMHDFETIQTTLENKLENSLFIDTEPNGSDSSSVKNENISFKVEKVINLLIEYKKAFEILSSDQNSPTIIATKIKEQIENQKQVFKEINFLLHGFSGQITDRVKQIVAEYQHMQKVLSILPIHSDKSDEDFLNEHFNNYMEDQQILNKTKDLLNASDKSEVLSKVIEEHKKNEIFIDCFSLIPTFDINKPKESIQSLLNDLKQLQDVQIAIDSIIPEKYQSEETLLSKITVIIQDLQSLETIINQFPLELFKGSPLQKIKQLFKEFEDVYNILSSENFQSEETSLSNSDKINYILSHLKDYQNAFVSFNKAINLPQVSPTEQATIIIQEIVKKDHLLDEIRKLYKIDKNEDIIVHLNNKLDEMHEYQQALLLVPQENSQNIKGSIQEILKLIEQYKNQEIKLNDIVSFLPKDQELIDKVAFLKEQYLNIQGISQSLSQNLGNLSYSGTPIEIINQTLNKISSLQNEIDQCRSLFNKSNEFHPNDIDLYQTINDAQKEWQENCLLLQNINKAIPFEYSNSNKNVFQAVSALINDFNQIKSERDLFISIFSSDGNSKETLDKAQQLLKDFEQIERIIPKEFQGKTTERISQLVQQYHDLLREQSQFSSIIPSDHQGNVSEKIDKLVRDTQNILNLCYGVENSKKLTDLYDNIRALFNSILWIIPVNNDKEITVLEALNKAIKLLNSLHNLHDKIIQVISNDTGKKINDENLISEIAIICDEWKNFNDQNQQMNELIPSKFNKKMLPDRIRQMKRALESTESELHDAQEDNQKLEQKIHSLVQLNDDLNMESNNVQDKISELNRQFKALQKERKKIENIIMNNNEEEESSLIDTLINMKNELDSLQKEHKMIDSMLQFYSGTNLNSKINQLISQFNDYKEQIVDSLKLLDINPETDEKLPSNIQKLLEMSKSLATRLNDFQGSTNIQENPAVRNTNGMFGLEEMNNRIKELEELIHNLECIHNEYKEIDKIVPNSQSDNNLLARIKMVLDQLNHLNKEIEKSSVLISKDKTPLDKKIKNLLEKLSESNEQLSKLQAEKSTLLNILQKENDGSLQEKIERLINENKSLKDQNELMKNENNEKETKILEYQNQIQSSAEKLKEFANEKEQIASLLLPNNDKPETESTIQKILPRIKYIIKENKQLQEFSSEFQEKLNKSMTQIDKLRSMINEIKNLLKVVEDTEIQNSIKDLINSESQLQSTIKTIDQLLIEKVNMKNGNVLTRETQLLTLFINKQNELSSLKENFEKISSKLPQNISGNIFAKLSKLIECYNQILAIRKILSCEGDIVFEVSNLFNDKQQMDLLIKQIREALEVDSSANLTEVASVILSNLKTISEVFAQFLTLIAGGSKEAPLKIKFPLSEEVKNKLFSMISEFKTTSEKALEDIQNILILSRDSGYIGNNPIEALKAIKDAANAEGRYQSLDEYHQQITEMRKLQEKERASYDKRIANVKKKLNEKQEFLTELQTKINEKDESYFDQINILQTSNRRLTNELEDEKRIKEELLRVFHGQPIDQDFLSSRLGDSHMIVLTIAKSIRKEEL